MPRTGESIFKRKDGRYEARYINTYTDTGRAIYKSVYAKTYAEVKKKRIEAQNTTKSIPIKTINSDMTFCELAHRWLYLKRSALKPSTYITYSNAIERKIIPAFSGILLRQITKEKCESICFGLYEQGLSVKTVRDVAAILRAIVEYGQNMGIVTEFPKLKLRLPKNTKKIHVLSVENQRILTEYLIKHVNNSNCGILLSLYLGLRVGELCALKWSDVLVSEACLHVGRTLQRLQCSVTSDTKTEIIITTPKSSSSVREIPIPQFLLPMIEKYACEANVYVLTGTTIPTEPRVMENRLKAILKKCSITQVNFHTLRHTFATRCVEQGFDIKVLSEILGHSSVKITMDRYVHPSQEQKKKCMALLDNIFYSSYK